MFKLELLTQKLLNLPPNTLKILRAAFKSQKRATQVLGMNKHNMIVDPSYPSDPYVHELIAISNALEVSPHQIIQEHECTSNIHPLVLEYFEKTNDHYGPIISK